MKICSCYDEDCKDVKRPLHCWFGAWGAGIADGACPMLRSTYNVVSIETNVNKPQLAINKLMEIWL